VQPKVILLLRLRRQKLNTKLALSHCINYVTRLAQSMQLISHVKLTQLKWLASNECEKGERQLNLNGAC
jgi:hypothetical protein